VTVYDSQYLSKVGPVSDFSMTSKGAENGIFFEFSLCLSRACLGKTIVLMYKWHRKNAVFRRRWEDIPLSRRAEVKAALEVRCDCKTTPALPPWRFTQPDRLRLCLNETEREKETVDV
jgi:hypothetical protein